MISREHNISYAFDNVSITFANAVVTVHRGSLLLVHKTQYYCVHVQRPGSLVAVE